MCGGIGCLETVCSHSALIARYAELSGETSGTVTVERVVEASSRESAVALQALEECGHYLGIALVNLITLLSPEFVVVTGGIAEAGDVLLEPARRVIRSRAFPPVHRNVPIIRGQLRSASGAYGAAALVLKQSECGS